MTDSSESGVWRREAIEKLRQAQEEEARGQQALAAEVEAVSEDMGAIEERLAREEAARKKLEDQVAALIRNKPLAQPEPPTTSVEPTTDSPHHSAHDWLAGELVSQDKYGGTASHQEYFASLTEQQRDLLGNLLNSPEHLRNLASQKPQHRYARPDFQHAWEQFNEEVVAGEPETTSLLGSYTGKPFMVGDVDITAPVEGMGISDFRNFLDGLNERDRAPYMTLTSRGAHRNEYLAWCVDNEDHPFAHRDFRKFLQRYNPPPEAPEEDLSLEGRMTLSTETPDVDNGGEPSALDGGQREEPSTELYLSGLRFDEMDLPSERAYRGWLDALSGYHFAALRGAITGEDTESHSALEQYCENNPQSPVAQLFGSKEFRGAVEVYSQVTTVPEIAGAASGHESPQSLLGDWRNAAGWSDDELDVVHQAFPRLVGLDKEDIANLSMEYIIETGAGAEVPVMSADPVDDIKADFHEAQLFMMGEGSDSSSESGAAVPSFKKESRRERAKPKRRSRSEPSGSRICFVDLYADQRGATPGDDILGGVDWKSDSRYGFASGVWPEDIYVDELAIVPPSQQKPADAIAAETPEQALVMDALEALRLSSHQTIAHYSGTDDEPQVPTSKTQEVQGLMDKVSRALDDAEHEDEPEVDVPDDAMQRPTRDSRRFRQAVSDTVPQNGSVSPNRKEELSRLYKSWNQSFKQDLYLLQSDDVATSLTIWDPNSLKDEEAVALNDKYASWMCLRDENNDGLVELVQLSSGTAPPVKSWFPWTRSDAQALFEDGAYKIMDTFAKRFFEYMSGKDRGRKRITRSRNPHAQMRDGGTADLEAEVGNYTIRIGWRQHTKGVHVSYLEVEGIQQYEGEPEEKIYGAPLLGIIEADPEVSSESLVEMGIPQNELGEYCTDTEPSDDHWEILQSSLGALNKSGQVRSMSRIVDLSLDGVDQQKLPPSLTGLYDALHEVVRGK